VRGKIARFVMARFLVVEKRGELQRLLRRRFPSKELALDVVPVIDEALDQFDRGAYDVLIWDADVSGEERSRAVEVFKTLSKDSPRTRFMIVHKDENGAVRYDALKGVLFQTIKRPGYKQKLVRFIERTLNKQRVPGEGEPPHPDLLIPVEFEGIIAVSLPMRAVVQRILEAASTDIPVLVTGETGTGKELVAAAIHKRSSRKDKPYVPVNTGAMAPELIASELFGHEKGAYTGALDARAGLFEQAHGGTIFLDEISTMDDKTQVSLLRVLEEKTLRRVGGAKDIHVDVRVIAATNENIEEAVKQKRFREDLYYRLDVFPIHLPPLRARPGAVTLLTDHFVSYFDSVYKKNVRAVPLETYRYLRRYPWPGNVRELKNVIQRAVLIAKGKELTPDLIPSRIREAANAQPESAAQSFPIRLGMTLGAVEREFVRMTLESSGGNKKEAARILGISRRALYNKLKRHGLP
jgi:DNA-binding NtrC family response regulator